MAERVLAQGALRKLIPEIDGIQNPRGGSYIIFGPKGTDFLAEDTECAIVLILVDESYDDIEFVRSNQLEPVYDAALARHVLEAARKMKPNVSTRELIEALDYYLYNDSFTPLSKED